jgi:hypothetical protein
VPRRNCPRVHCGAEFSFRNRDQCLNLDLRAVLRGPARIHPVRFDCVTASPPLADHSGAGLTARWSKGGILILMPTNRLTPEIITAAILGFEAQKKRIDVQIAELRAMLSGGPTESATTSETPTLKRRKFSAAARQRMKEAQQRRWAKIKGESEPPSEQVTLQAVKPKRKLSKAGRAAIVAALKKRWAAKKAAAVKTAPSAAKKAVFKKAAVKKTAAKKAAAKKTGVKKPQKKASAPAASALVAP